MKVYQAIARVGAKGREFGETPIEFEELKDLVDEINQKIDQFFAFVARLPAIPQSSAQTRPGPHQPESPETAP